MKREKVETKRVRNNSKSLNRGDEMVGKNSDVTALEKTDLVTREEIKGYFDKKDSNVVIGSFIKIYCADGQKIQEC